MSTQARTRQKFLTTFLPSLCILAFAATSATAQWVVQPSGTESVLNAVHFPEDGTGATGYIVGDSGTVLKTTDFGEHWKPITVNTTLPLHSVYFLDAKTGYITGDSGLVLSTTDGGGTWMEQRIAGHPQLLDVTFPDRQAGFAVGNIDLVERTLIKTTDAGTTWRRISLPDMNNGSLAAIHFPSATTGYCVAPNLLLKSVDAGETWERVIVPFATSVLEGCYFSDSVTGGIVGWYNPFLSLTTDGGATWANRVEDMTNSKNGSYQLFSIDFPSASIGFTSGWYGEIMETTDGGATWNLVYTAPGKERMFSISSPDGVHCVAVGERGVIVRRTVESTSGIDNQQSPLRFTVVPNPSIDHLDITLSNGTGNGSDGQLTLTDVLGRTVLQRTYAVPTGSITDRIITTDLPPGIYRITLRLGGTTRSQNVIVQ